jgi:hypothetical protein
MFIFSSSVFVCTFVCSAIIVIENSFFPFFCVFFFSQKFENKILFDYVINSHEQLPEQSRNHHCV